MQTLSSFLENRFFCCLSEACILLGLVFFHRCVGSRCPFCFTHMVRYVNLWLKTVADKALEFVTYFESFCLHKFRFDYHIMREKAQSNLEHFTSPKISRCRLFIYKR